MESYPSIVDAIKKTIASRSAAEALSNYHLKISTLGRTASALGMSSLVTERFLERFMNERF
ncbi:hypothetical protein CHCC14561_3881 [Bacillus licheniformis]|nr:hypothetical protein CHCC14561_3881 [Bacillus licheniformis]